jgi:rod shape-determining protein MreC
VATYSGKRRRALILLALTTVMLITIDIRGGGASSGVRSLFGTVFRPVEGVARVVTRPVSNAWYGVTNYEDVVDENELLREKVAQQEGAAVAAAASVRLAQELLALNGLPTLAGINSVSAQVIGDSPSNFSQTVEINQGSESGIRVGMPVLNAAGLVGKVTKVYDDRSIVMLITDPAYALSVKIVKLPEEPVAPPPGEGVESTTTTTTTTLPAPTTSFIAGFTPGTTTIPNQVTRPTVQVPSLTVPVGNVDSVRETGVLEGRGPTRLPIVRFIDSSQRFGRVQVGSPIVTSGGSLSLAPPDIVVGTVSRINERLGTAGPVLEVSLVADLTNLSFVRILLYQPVTEQNATTQTTVAP